MLSKVSEDTSWTWRAFALIKFAFMTLFLYFYSPQVLQGSAQPHPLHLKKSQPSRVPLLIKDFKRQFSDREQQLPRPLKRLLIAYPDSLRTAILTSPQHGQLIWRDGTTTEWQIKEREYNVDEWSALTLEARQELLKINEYDLTLKKATLSEQLLQSYPRDRKIPVHLPAFFEPGRLRDESFFKQMYGSTRRQVGRSLTSIKWGSQRLKVNRLHRIDERLIAIYQELSALPKRFRSYIKPSAGAFHWRMIKGTNRLSVHSFGAAIDIAVKRSNYWRWTLKVYGRDAEGFIPYKNRFPEEVVKIFERYGFIWGGWWYHHDTMHFEYRPELLVSLTGTESHN